MKKSNFEILKKYNASSYNIKGYTSHIQTCENDEDLVRIIALTKENCGVDFNLRKDLMSKSFPSVWIEVLDKYKNLFNISMMLNKCYSSIKYNEHEVYKVSINVLFDDFESMLLQKLKNNEQFHRS